MRSIFDLKITVPLYSELVFYTFIGERSARDWGYKV